MTRKKKLVKKASTASTLPGVHPDNIPEIFKGAPPKCDRKDCGQDACRGLKILIYPPKQIMEMYGKTDPLGEVMTSLLVCEAHSRDVVPTSILSPEQLQNICNTVSRTNFGLTVDVAACKVAAVPFDDPACLEVHRRRDLMDEQEARRSDKANRKIILPGDEDWHQ